MTIAPMIHLDCNAAAPGDPRVLNAMLPHRAAHYGNPASGHVAGRHAKAVVEPELLGEALSGGSTVLQASPVEHFSGLHRPGHPARQGGSLIVAWKSLAA